MTAFLAIVRKDLQLFGTDRRAVLMQIVAPIVISAFFGFVFSRTANPSNDEPARIRVLVSDEDGSAISGSVAKGLASEPALEIKAFAADAARDEVRRGHASVAVILPKGFGEAAARALFGGTFKPEVPLRYDPSHTAELALVRGLLTQHAMQSVSRTAFAPEGIAAQARALDAAPFGGDQKDALRALLHDLARLDSAAPAGSEGSGFPGLSLPYTVHEEAVTAQASVPYNGFAHAFAGMSVQFILFSGINLGVGILLDKQRGVWKRLRAAPLSKSFVLGAKTASGALIAFLTLAIVFGFAIALFGVRVEGSAVGFVSVLLAIAFMASTFGLLIAAVGRTPEATRGISIFAVLIMVMLGGAWVPTFVFPGWLQKATLVIPARWAVDGIEGMTWRGLSLRAALPGIGVLLSFAILFGLLAAWRFDWESD
jgi:ABC-type multidrug transport system permease subunit